MKKNIYLILLLTLLSCNNVVENVNDKRSYAESCRLLIADSLSFPLDSESQPLNNCMQVYEKEKTDSTFFVFYNEYNNSIYYYDYYTRKNSSIVHLEKEGPNGVFPYQSGFHIRSMDSIFFYSMYTNRVFLLDSKGKKKDTYDLYSNISSEIYPPVMRLRTDRPLYFINNNIYMSGYNHGEFINEDSTKLPLAIVYDTKKRSAEVKLGYPELYRQGNWGEVYFREIFWCYNESVAKFILSFPNDHNLYLTDLNNVHPISGGSKYADVIKSLDHLSSFPMPKEKRIYHFLESYYYSAIVYDKYRNVYYRFVQHPWKDPQIKIKPWGKPLSVIIFDENFARIGETLLDFKYRLSSERFLITKEGLLLQEYNENEDEIKFAIFKLEKI